MNTLGYDIKQIEAKLTAQPTKIAVVKASSFFTQEQYISSLQKLTAKLIAHNSTTTR